MPSSYNDTSQSFLSLDSLILKPLPNTAQSSDLNLESNLHSEKLSSQFDFINTDNLRKASIYKITSINQNKEDSQRGTLDQEEIVLSRLHTLSSIIVKYAKICQRKIAPLKNTDQKQNWDLPELGLQSFLERENQEKIMHKNSILQGNNHKTDHSVYNSDIKLCNIYAYNSSNIKQSKQTVYWMKQMLFTSSDLYSNNYKIISFALQKLIHKEVNSLRMFSKEYESIIKNMKGIPDNIRIQLLNQKQANLFCLIIQHSKRALEKMMEKGPIILEIQKVDLYSSIKRDQFLMFKMLRSIIISYICLVKQSSVYYSLLKQTTQFSIKHLKNLLKAYKQIITLKKQSKKYKQ